MIKTLLFDFDGVIVDSMKMKGEAFRSSVSEFEPSKVDELVGYHFANGGLSRFEKFRHFFANILKTPVGNQEIEARAATFSELVKEELTQPKYLIHDAVQYIKSSRDKYDFHLVSGSEESELKFVVEELGLGSLFLSIRGSPTSKSENIKHLLSDSKVPSECAMIGDSLNDFEAAQVNGIYFFGYNNESLRSIGDGYIEKFSAGPHPWENLKKRRLN